MKGMFFFSSGVESWLIRRRRKSNDEQFDQNMLEIRVTPGDWIIVLEIKTSSATGQSG